ncbi:MAG: glycoside hydrolase family 15 protein [Pyrinomonadaceae bacterium MAG19_C2-C3]|nr:glycoside hydrolase family 15 protein [Pyrinomonadaceae bacterium MAG19_C2-C3]
MKKILLALVFSSLSSLTFAQNNLAPGAPGKDAQWESAGKTGVGTSTTLESKVWFTLLDGVMTEVYYPTVDVANVRLLQFIVVDKAGKVETERDDAIHTTEAVEGLTFRQKNKAKSGAWEIVKTYITDVERASVLIDVSFKESKAGEHRLYIYYDSSLNNSGMHDSAWTQDGALLASDADKASALVGVMPFIQDARLSAFNKFTNGYFETSDGLTQLKAKGEIDGNQVRAANGNTVQVAQIFNGGTIGTTLERFTLGLGFGKESDEALKNARDSIRQDFNAKRNEYQNGWREYVKSLRKVDTKYQRQFEMAAMVLKAHEDKTYRGANIASLSVPWGGGSNANEPNVGGYHLVWARDLYQVATAYMALGDKAAADRALHYLFKVQQKADGSFPQNSWLDGRPFWGSLQLDEVAFPLILAYQLGRTDNETYIKHVKPAADFIVKNGAYTPQERWEEEAGFSPSTMAAEIAGLVCAADIARKNNDEANAKVYEAKADDWARNVEAWTATTTGFYGDKNYYLRITENNNPNDGEPRELNNGAGTFDERRIVDAGFLELVRLGIKPADDALIAKSIKVVDEILKVETPNGATFYRYNNDGYGEMDDGRNWNFDGKYTGKGRLWALLAGERGQYELANGRRADAVKRLDAMLGFANEGLMIPEQVWDKAQPLPNGFKFGEGTGAATPLAWSMAQFIRLAANIQEGRNMDTPDVVFNRYVKKTNATSSIGRRGATDSRGRSSR